LGAGGFDFNLVKTDSAGNLNWSNTYGRSGDDFAYSLVNTSDGGYALAGYTSSSGAGYYDFYMVKTDSAGNKQWSKTYGGTGDDEARSLIQTSDDGYALAGWTNSFGGGGYDFYLVKTDSAGNMNWNQTYGRAGDNQAYSIIQTTDGGYALAGYTDSSGAGGYDFYLIKIDSAGASPSSAGFNWSSIEGYVIIAAIAIIAVAAVLLIISRIGGRKGKF
jgi:hypothetical protein